ncbi:MAG: DpnD/PcfM family protein [Prevotella sp.]|nr:DpnD/PcfM family protein [Prevotella sp.]
MKYTFEIIETLSEIVTVNASCEDEAYMDVKRRYQDEEIVLDYKNHIDTEIKMLEKSKK